MAARSTSTFASLLLLLLALSPLTALTAEPVPDVLQDWRAWALRGQEFRACPFLSSRQPGNADSHRCAWPGPLSLELNANSGSFQQRWQVFAEGWVVLPGNGEHWPRDVRLNGNAAAVVERNGLPQIRVPTGSHVISGRFGWEARPESLAVASQTGVVVLTVDGRVVPNPERPNGAVWLGQRRAAAEQDALQLQVYRLLRDTSPAQLLTQIRLQVSGEGREELLGLVLPQGFTAMDLESELAARLEPEGRLRVQLRPGSYTLTLTARASNVAAQVTRPVAGGPWVSDEIWSFEANDRLRVVSVEGAESIDPAQANVPGEWSAYPAYRLGEGGALNISERSRGLANLDDNQLNLRRDLWLDFNHQGFTAVDHIDGQLNRDWRLDMQAPYRLQSARSGEESLLVTQGSEGTLSGIELRDANLSLMASSRIETSRGSLPATGWTTRFNDVNGTVHLPPGHRLLGVRGADEAFGSWINNWELWNLFGVLVVVVFTYWVAGVVPAILAAGMLALMYQEAPYYIWLWASLLAAIALVRAAPEGKLKSWAVRYRIASIVVLALALLPMLFGQLRLAFYPQLDHRGGGSSMANDDMRARNVDMATAEVAPAMPPPPVAAPAPEPQAEYDSVESAGRAVRERLEEVTVTGNSVSKAAVTQRYATGTALQAGPGVPNWSYNDYNFRWSGPVDQAQTVQFIYLGPWGMALWRILGVALTALLIMTLLRSSFGWNMKLPGALSKHIRTSSAALILLALVLAPAAVQAQATPSPEILNELRTRLTEAPRCVPNCAELTRADIEVNGDRLTVRFQVSALASVAVAVPHAGERWQIDRAEIDGRAALTVGREPDNSLWMPVTPGAHTVILSGRLAGSDSIQLTFPAAPRVVAASAQGWDVTGIVNARLPSGALELTRRRSETQSGRATLAASEFPAFAQVTRTFNLHLDWTVTTQVERLAPRTAPLQLSVPLVAGESVLTPGIEVREGSGVQVAMARNQTQFTWSSALNRGEALNLSMPEGAARSEVWTFDVGEQWHADFEGLPASLPTDESGGGRHVFHYYPRPSESLVVRVRRPEAVAGSTLAIDNVEYRTEIGKRSLNAILNMNYRSTQGGQQVITLPEAARVTQVTLDGQVVPVRPEKGALAVALLPGQHQLAVQWTSDRGAGLRMQPDAVQLGASASNIRTSITLPDDRWILLARGPGVGPALLYWAELISFLIVAWLLGRLTLSPLKTWEWLLLGVGLSTLSWPVFVGVAIWLFAMRWRAAWQHERVFNLPFNAVQVVLAALTLIAVSSLVFTGIRSGLLARPDMSIVSTDYSGSPLSWFLDRTEGSLPQPAIISVPMWLYRLFIFAWALWIAMALTRWLKQAWSAWISGGHWRSAPQKAANPPTQS